MEEGRERERERERGRPGRERERESERQREASAGSSSCIGQDCVSGTYGKAGLLTACVVTDVDKRM
jgi:hypothetical protein